MWVRLASRNMAEARVMPGLAPWCSTSSWAGSLATCSIRHPTGFRDILEHPLKRIHQDGGVTCSGTCTVCTEQQPEYSICRVTVHLGLAKKMLET